MVLATSAANSPAVNRRALGSMRRSISTSTASSATTWVFSTRIEQCASLTSPARNAAANPGNVVARARATSIALPAAYREVRRATEISCSRCTSGR